MLYQSYLTTAKNILTVYKGDEPFAIFLKKYFGAHKKFGSRDRRYITSVCYAYFRLGKAAGEPNNENLLTALFLTEQLYSDIVHFFKPGWDEWIGKPTEEKIAFINFPITTLFPFTTTLSTTVNHQKYCESFLKQPKLFLRLRPHKKNIVVEKLQKSKIPLALLNDDCIALANATKLDDVIVADKEAVIQDYNSQQVFSYLKRFVPDTKKPVTAWDCCAASGGKSILLYDILKKHVELTVSDIRLPILLNLHQRFTKAGVKDYNYFLGDLTALDFQFPDTAFKGVKNKAPANEYQLIICDVPCTGSGTWSRTPENLFYFKPEIIDDYAVRQKQIVSNAVPYLKKDGLLFYITCSVFKKENEEVVNFIKEKFRLQLQHMELLKGYDKKADSMFVAVFSKLE
jgi:16S rRNA (cytosine967-C5)-methyltransferase